MKLLIKIKQNISETILKKLINYEQLFYFIFLIYSDYSFVQTINCKKYYSYLININTIKVYISFKY